MNVTSRPRSEIGTAYQWDLSALYPSLEHWEADVKNTQELLLQIELFSSSLCETSSTLLQGLRLVEIAEEYAASVYIYAHLKSHEDTTNNFNQGLANRAASLESQVYAATAFLKPELLKLSRDKLEEFLTENLELCLYRKKLERILAQQEHTLSQVEEEILAGMVDFTDATTIFNSLAYADLKPGSVADSEGTLHEVTESSYRSLMEHPDRLLRNRTFKSLLDTYGQHRNTLSAAYSSYVKQCVFLAKTRKYDSSLEMALSEDNVPVKLYWNIIQTVRDNKEPLHRYMDLRKRMMNIDELRYYDFFTPMVSNLEWKVPFDQAKDLILEALAPLGEEYVQSARNVFDERWVDVYPNTGKLSGAYAWGSHSSHPYILLNYGDTLSDLFTLAHEMGHALHSHNSFKSQPLAYCYYSAIVGEIASTVHEHLLMESLLAKTFDKNARVFLLNYSLEQFRTTVYRQTMFAEFEKFAHEKVEACEALTADLLREYYGQLNTDYYGPTLVIDDELKNEWSRIPQFYHLFYVYKYANGFAVAMALANQLLESGENSRARYLNFLRSGSSEDPIDLLRIAGVDMTTSQPIMAAIDVFRNRLEELEKLLSS